MRSMPAVNRSFLRISATWKALRMVESIGLAGRAGHACAGRSCDSSSQTLRESHRRAGRAWNSALERVTGAADALDALAGGLAKGVGVNCERLAQISLSQHLDRHALAGGQALGLHRLERDICAGVKAAL